MVRVCMKMKKVVGGGVRRTRLRLDPPMVLLQIYHGSHMDWKTWKKGKTFSQGILNRLQKSGNFTQNTGKMGQFYPKYQKSEDIYFYFFSEFFIEVYLLKKILYLLNSSNITLKKYWKMERKYWKSQGNLSVQKCNHVYTCRIPRNCTGYLEQFLSGLQIYR